MLGSGDNSEAAALGRMTLATVTVAAGELAPSPSPAISSGRVREERVPQWAYQETRDLIAIRAELERDFNSTKRNKALWEAVASKMREKSYRRTPDQCKCKWKNLVNKYKGKETSDMENGRQCPFFEELHSVYTERAKNMHRPSLESEVGSLLAKKRMKRMSGDGSSEDLSKGENEDEDASDEERTISSSNPRKRKLGREKQTPVTVSNKSSGPSASGNIKYGGGSNSEVKEMLQAFLQQQQKMEMQWRESVDRRAHERLMFEQEWRQSMEKLERERLVMEQAWREREEQRRMREEQRAEKRDEILTTLLNKLLHDNSF